MTNWKYKLDVSDFLHDEELEPNEIANRTADLIENGNFSLALQEEFGTEVEYLLEEMRDADTVEWFDTCWNSFYDMADYLKIWVVTH